MKTNVERPLSKVGGGGSTKKERREFTWFPLLRKPSFVHVPYSNFGSHRVSIMSGLQEKKDRKRVDKCIDTNSMCVCARARAV